MRLFVALELDEPARRLLARCRQQLEAIDRQIRWARLEQIHLTLKFLGEVPDNQLARIREALDPLAAFEPVAFTIEGAGWFGSPRSPRVLWVGVRWPNPVLDALQKSCERRLAELGLPPEDRPFRPHLTLGRVPQGRGGPEVIAALSELRSQGVGPLEQRSSRVVLFESRLHRDGSQYTAVHAVPLGGDRNP